MQPLVLSGARVIIKVNNKVFAAGFVVDYAIETAETTLSGIDNVLPDELAPQNISVSMNLRVYRTPDNDPVAAQIAPGGDSANAQKDFSESPYITVEVRDKVTDRTLIYLPRAWVFRRAGTGESESLITETWGIKSIGFIGPGTQTSGLIPVIKNIFS